MYRDILSFFKRMDEVALWVCLDRTYFVEIENTVAK